VARAGGWGWRFGDEGSGYDLARAALRAASQAADGRAAPTRLLDAILEFWKLREPADLIARVYRSGLRNADLAALASVVIRVAEEGDAAASQLIIESGNALADALDAVARALKIEPSAIPLALAGGLLLDAPTMRASVLSAASARGLNFQPVTLVREPVRGAVRLALDLMARSETDS
jgi:N-acetylglucosamine kinase